MHFGKLLWYRKKKKRNSSGCGVNGNGNGNSAPPQVLKCFILRSVGLKVYIVYALQYVVYQTL